MAGLGEGSEKKRKLSNENEIEIDVSAPEPASKKALRKAKKKGTEPSEPAPEDQNDTVAQDGAPSKTRSDYGVWIGNLAFSVTRDDLRQFITSNCSFPDTTITRVHMPKNPDKFGKAQNKGFAYVDFSTSRALEEAMGLSEQLIGGRRVLIKNAKSFEGRPEKTQEDRQTANASGSPPSKRIFVGNLGFDVTKESLEEHFAPCGTVASIHMATFQDTGKCKGYAWVEFEDLAAAEAAVKGYVMIKEDDDEDEEEDEGSDSEQRKRSKSKNPRQRRVWVNQLLGRRMRTEFAEDPTTRYKKRFGENKTNDAISNDDDSTDAGAAPARPPKKARHSKPEYSRYGQDTVQKLSGAIVESKGQRVTFD